MEQNVIAGPGLEKLGKTDLRKTDLLRDPFPAQEERTDRNSTLANARTLYFPQITALLLDELPSEASRRVYLNTFQQWEQFADYNDLNVVELFSDNIKSFLYSRHLSYSTRLSRKSHIQRLLRVAAHVDPSFGIYYVQLRDLKIEGTSEDNAPRGKPRELSHSECRQLLSVWRDDDSHMGIRNRAVLFLLLNAAIRNSELVALRWEDLNWDAQTLMISRDDKGQESNMPILDASPDTMNALRLLQLTQTSVSPDHSIPFSFMFPALSTGKYARFTPGKNVRTSIQTIRNIVKQSAERAGLGKLSCLDLRHTSLRLFSKSDISHADIARSADG